MRFPCTAFDEIAIKAKFIEPMLLLRTERLPEGEEWLYEVKHDGYRALAIRSAGKTHLRSRNDNDFDARYPELLNALAEPPDETVIDARWWRWTRRENLPSTPFRTMVRVRRRCFITCSMCLSAF
jgi:ATP-dependent DNA ligase